MKFFSKTKKNKKSISQNRKPNLNKEDNNEETQNEERFDDRKNDLTTKEEWSNDEELRKKPRTKNDLTTKEERSNDDWTLGGQLNPGSDSEVREKEE